MIYTPTYTMQVKGSFKLSANLPVLECLKMPLEFMYKEFPES